MGSLSWLNHGHPDQSIPELGGRHDPEIARAGTNEVPELEPAELDRVEGADVKAVSRPDHEEPDQQDDEGQDEVAVSLSAARRMGAGDRGRDEEHRDETGGHEKERGKLERAPRHPIRRRGRLACSVRGSSSHRIPATMTTGIIAATARSVVAMPACARNGGRRVSDAADASADLGAEDRSRQPPGRHDREHEERQDPHPCQRERVPVVAPRVQLGDPFSP